MIDVVEIHGSAPQQSGRNQLLASWRPALKDGVEKARGHDRPTPWLDLAYYGDHFLRSAGTKCPAVVAEKPDKGTLAFLIQLQDEIIAPAASMEALEREDL